MKQRNIPIAMTYLTKEDGQIQLIKFKIKLKDESESTYKVLQTKDVKHQRHSGNKVILFYSLILINNKEYDVIFRFDVDKTKWELAMI